MRVRLVLGTESSTILSNFKQNWQAKLHDLNKYPIVRTYALFKFDFECETYLNAVRDRWYRNAISKFCLSSHNLEIERGRYCNPKVPVSERLCVCCNCIEDEQHFLVSCKLYEGLRVDLYDKVSKIITDFYEIGDREKFVRLMNSRDNNVLTWLGKFLYMAQSVRVGHHTYSLCDIWQSCISNVYLPMITTDNWPGHVVGSWSPHTCINARNVL